jgi:hypothetical protein
MKYLSSYQPLAWNNFNRWWICVETMKNLNPDFAVRVDVPESQGGINPYGSLHVRRYQNSRILRIIQEKTQ